MSFSTSLGPRSWTGAPTACNAQDAWQFQLLYVLDMVLVQGKYPTVAQHA